MSDCVLCDWDYDPFDPPLAAYLGPAILPLTWDTGGPRQVKAYESVFSTLRGVATVFHWALEHPEQLCWALEGAAIETDGFPRKKLYGSLAPPGGFPF